MKAPQLTCPVGADNDGAFALRWSGDGVAWRVEENGTLVYAGTDTATTVTGRAAGTYEYRVAAVGDGDAVVFGAPCTVEVTPPSLAVAFALAAIGAVVFAATLWMIKAGDRAAAAEDAR